MPLTQAAPKNGAGRALPDAYAKWEPLATKGLGHAAGRQRPYLSHHTHQHSDPDQRPRELLPRGRRHSLGRLGQPAPPRAPTTSHPPFGPRFHPIYHEWRMHNGQDMGAPEGTQIFAACNGAVIFTGMSGGAGNLTEIDCGGGVQTRYMHQARITVTVGQSVKAGDPIGLVGNTGASTGAHLHFEVVIGGTAVDPVPFMARQGITL